MVLHRVEEQQLYLRFSIFTKLKATLPEQAVEAITEEQIFVNVLPQLSLAAKSLALLTRERGRILSYLPYEAVASVTRVVVTQHSARPTATRTQRP